MKREQLDIHLRKGLRLLIYPHSRSAECFEMEDAAEYGESRWQLQEGREYEYEFLTDEGESADACFEPRDGIIIPRRKRSEGTIKTGLYVGTMPLRVVDGSGELELRLEIQSVKADYRKDYQKMLNDITKEYTDLVMMQGSPVTQRFEVDFNEDSKTLYQKFAFVKSVVDNEDFDEAIHKIMQNPVRSWQDTTNDKHIENVRRLNRKGLRQIAQSNDRVSCQTLSGLSSLPRRIEVSSKEDTIDTSENQFVKYVLKQFYGFCEEVASKRNANAELKREVDAVNNKLLRYINSSFFKDINIPRHLNLNSPVLQRKEGYREILQGWLIFDLAAQLNWKGGDNVYEAGKRNVAALYEYWLFFKLLRIVGEVFHIDNVEKQKLVTTTNDQLNLEIRQGRTMMISGVDDTTPRRLNVRFFYNRTFGHRNDIHSAGSWTMPMRPDYTLTIWPGDITEEEAEREEVIVHIHFDAKYRVNKIVLEEKDDDLSNIDNDSDPLNVELNKEEEIEELGEYEIGMYKRADILKMHAYKDAIRRTSGAYILYPGTEKVRRTGFHEIIPGLGAFCISPGNETDQAAALKVFLMEIKQHMLNRVSQREKMAYQSYSIYKDEPVDTFREDVPEAIGENRDFQVDETYVLIGYCDASNMDFVCSNMIYNVRTGDKDGNMDLAEFMKARYALIWNNSDQHFFKINKRDFKIYSERDYVRKGYTSTAIREYMKEHSCDRETAIANLPLDGFYATCGFNKNGVEKEFQGIKWNTNAFNSYKRKPFPMKLSRFMKYRIEES